MIESTLFYISGYDSMSWYVRLVRLVYSTDTLLVILKCVQATAGTTCWYNTVQNRRENIIIVIATTHSTVLALYNNSLYVCHFIIMCTGTGV